MKCHGTPWNPTDPHWNPTVLHGFGCGKQLRQPIPTIRDRHGTSPANPADLSAAGYAGLSQLLVGHRLSVRRRCFHVPGAERRPGGGTTAAAAAFPAVPCSAQGTEEAVNQDRQIPPLPPAAREINGSLPADANRRLRLRAAARS